MILNIKCRSQQHLIVLDEMLSQLNTYTMCTFELPYVTAIDISHWASFNIYEIKFFGTAWLTGFHTISSRICTKCAYPKRAFWWYFRKKKSVFEQIKNNIFKRIYFDRPGAVVVLHCSKRLSSSVWYSRNAHLIFFMIEYTRYPSVMTADIVNFLNIVYLIRNCNSSVRHMTVIYSNKNYLKTNQTGTMFNSKVQQIKKKKYIK